MKSLLNILDGARCCIGGMHCYACPYNDYIEAVTGCKKKLIEDLYKAMIKIKKEKQ